MGCPDAFIFWKSVWSQVWGRLRKMPSSAKDGVPLERLNVNRQTITKASWNRSRPAMTSGGEPLSRSARRRLRHARSNRGDRSRRRKEASSSTCHHLVIEPSQSGGRDDGDE